MDVDRRPTSVALVSAALVAMSLVSALVGFAATAVSACCGSPDPPDNTYAVVGLVVGGAQALAGVALWSRFLPRRALLVCAAGVPVACAIAAASSDDLAGVLPFAVVAWLAFWWFLRRPRVAAWLHS